MFPPMRRRSVGIRSNNCVAPPIARARKKTHHGNRYRGVENIGGFKTLFANPVKGKRRAVYLRFEDGPHASFIVLSQNPVEVPGDAIKIDQVGVHHFAFWVDDLRERVEKLKAAGI